MTLIWTAMIAISVLCAAATGHIAELAPAAIQGTQTAVELALSMAGMLCLWMGVMEVMRRSGIAKRLSWLLRPILCRIFPSVSGDTEIMDSISANVSANLLGLGSAATPFGLDAARRMSKKSQGVASDALCMMIVCNTASIQLIPTTIAAVRFSQGCQTPFDILPAVWLASALSVSVGIFACNVFAAIWPLEQNERTRIKTRIGDRSMRSS